MRVIAVLGAGTGVGKTHVSTLLLRALRQEGCPVAPFKPLESGVQDNGGVPADAHALLEASGMALSLEDVCPWPLPRPLAPAEELERLGMTVSIDEIRAAAERLSARANNAPLLFEGAGGVLSPLTWDFHAMDLASSLGASVWLVIRDELGGLSSALTALESLRARSIPVHGVILNRFPDEQSVKEGANARALARLGVPEVWYADASGLDDAIVRRSRHGLESTQE